MSLTTFTRLTGAALLALGLAACQTEEPPAAEQAPATAAAETTTTTTTPAPAPAAAPAPAPEPAPVARPKPRPKPAPVVCSTCGRVTAIVEVKQKGEGSGAGAAIGAVAGGVAGHQVGGGRGKDVATAIGAIAGAMAGHEIEKRARSTLSYDISVAMEDGSTRTINVADLGGLTVGQAVHVEGTTLRPR